MTGHEKTGTAGQAKSRSVGQVGLAERTGVRRVPGLAPEAYAARVGRVRVWADGMVQPELPFNDTQLPRAVV